MSSVIRGLAAATVATAALFALLLAVGIAVNGSPFVYVVAATAMALFVLLDGDSKNAQMLGAGLGIVASFAIGALAGFGLLVISGLVGSVLAIGWTLAGSPLPGELNSNWLRIAAVASLIVVGVTVAVLVVSGGTLGHDESAYALKARSWLEGTPETGWSIHRAPVLSLYAYPVLAVGGEEPLLRLVGLLSVIGLAVSVWVLASRVAGSWAGPIAGVAVVAGPAVLRRSTEFLSDVGSAALLVVAMTILWREFRDDDGPSYRMLWLLLPALLAFYLRYQSILSFGLIALTVLALWWPKVRRNPGPILWLVLLGAAGLVPHVIYAISETGSPIGVLTRTGSAAGRDFVGEGLVHFAADVLWPLGGFVGPTALVLAAAGVFIVWKHDERRRAMLFLLLPAAGQVLALGLVSHGEPRFIFFPFALLIVAATLSLRELPSVVSSTEIRLAAYGGLAVLLMGSLALSAASARRSVDSRIGSNEPIELSSNLMVDLAAGASCGTMTSYLPQVTFYSACSTQAFDEAVDPATSVSRLVGDSRFMLLLEEGKRQPQGEDLSGLVDEAVSEPTIVDGASRDAALFEFSD